MLKYLKERTDKQPLHLRQVVGSSDLHLQTSSVKNSQVVFPDISASLTSMASALLASSVESQSASVLPPSSTVSSQCPSLDLLPSVYFPGDSIMSAPASATFNVQNTIPRLCISTRHPSTTVCSTLNEPCTSRSSHSTWRSLTVSRLLRE